MRRREFLRVVAAASLPPALSACSMTWPPANGEPAPERVWLDDLEVDDRSLKLGLGALGEHRADFGEIFLQHSESWTQQLVDGELGEPLQERLRGAGLRVVRDGQVGFQHTTDLGETGLVAAGRAAAFSLPQRDILAAAPLATRRFIAPGELYSVERHFAEVDAGRRRQIMLRTEALVRAGDPAVSNVTVTLHGADERVLVARLDGKLVADRRPMSRLSVQVTMVRRGISHSGFANLAGRHELDWYTEARLADLAARAVERTEILFDALTPPAGDMPVVLSAGTSGVLLHEAIGHAFEADFVAEGSSPYDGGAGSRIAIEEVSLVDDATLTGERGALNADDEGEAGRGTVLVRNGMLANLLHDRRTALRDSTVPTGNGRRSSYSQQPQPRMTCTYMEDGPHEADALTASMNRGIIAETYTGGAVDLGGGDFRFRVRHGWFVENGRRQFPVRDFELVGNGPELLRNITMVANDMRIDEGGWSCGKRDQSVPVSHGMPSVLVSTLGVRPLS